MCMAKKYTEKKFPYEFNYVTLCGEGSFDVIRNADSKLSTNSWLQAVKTIKKLFVYPHNNKLGFNKNCPNCCVLFLGSELFLFFSFW